MFITVATVSAKGLMLGVRRGEVPGEKPNSSPHLSICVCLLLYNTSWLLLALVQRIHPNSCAFLSSPLNSSTHLQYCSGNMTEIESSPTHFMYPWKLHDMKLVEETSLCGMAHNLKYI